MRKIFIFIALAFTCGSLKAQNINQSVVVTNDYQSTFADFQKQSTKLVVADSLYKFNYHFDYSVFDSPYKGSYEFEPYQIGLQLDTISYKANNLLLRFGVGFMPRPELDLEWSPLQAETIGLSISNRGRGRIGGFEPSQAFSDRVFGYDLSDNLALHIRSILGNNRFDFVLGYDAVFAKTALETSAYNSGKANLLYNSSSFLNLFDVQLDFGLRYYTDGLAVSNARTNGSNMSINGRLKPLVTNSLSFAIDFRFDTYNMTDTRSEIDNSISSYAALNPYFFYEWKGIDIKAGAKVDYTNARKFRISPVLNLDFDIKSIGLNMFAALTGGQSVNDYHSLKQINHFYIISPNTISQDSPVMTEHINAYLGVKGTIGHYFQYMLKGGYKNVSAMMLDAMPTAGNATLAATNAMISYANLDLKWRSSRVDIDAKAEYNYMEALSSSAVFAPAALRASLSGSYNWLKRIYAGLLLDMSTARKSLNAAYADLAEWYDLGLYGEYRFKANRSAWIRTGNMLGMPIERHPGFIEKEPYFTLGLSLIF